MTIVVVTSMIRGRDGKGDAICDDDDDDGDDRND